MHVLYNISTKVSLLKNELMLLMFLEKILKLRYELKVGPLYALMHKITPKKDAGFALIVSLNRLKVSTTF